ncbi:MDH1 [Malassezia furfur]|nr:MDH1 [Malassezia furfur]
MFARAALRNSVRAPASARYFSQTAAANRKVAVLGASGGIGQPLSLLMKLNPKVTELRLYDIRLAPGVAADLSHINTPAVTSGYAQDDLEGAVDGAEIVLIPAGMPRKPGMTRDDLFNAYIGVISNPVNSTVPIVAEVFKKAGVYDPKRLFGVTTLDTTRAATFLSGIAGSDPQTTNVPVIGGHSGVTIVPLISQAAQGDKVQAGEQYDKLVHRIQFGGDEVVKAKDGAGSATLSMAYAAAVFTEGLLKGLDGEAVTQCTFVESPLFKDQVDFFASPVEFGPEGVKNIPALPKLTAEEQKLLDACLPDLAKNIKKGVAWAAENP